ncbi:MAG: hypothetical protein RMI78_04760, partial [Nitrososphaerota archaeon]|nr:hypothetical protein [Nitrososphaerota archaeon]
MSLLTGQLEHSLRNVFAQNPHLVRYLDEWIRSGRESPRYMEQLSRELRYERRVNIVYPVGDPIFIHIYSRGPGLRPMYVIVQPAGGIKLGKLPEIVDELLIDLIDESIEAEDVEGREKALREFLRKVVEIRP